MQANLLAYARGLTDLAALIGTDNSVPAIHLSARPRGGSDNAITIQTISPGRGYDQGAANAISASRFQFDFWGETYAQARRAEIQLTADLEAIRNTTQGDTVFIRAFKDSDRDLDASKTAGGSLIFHISADFIINHKPA